MLRNSPCLLTHGEYFPGSKVRREGPRPGSAPDAEDALHEPHVGRAPRRSDQLAEQRKSAPWPKREKKQVSRGIDRVAAARSKQRPALPDVAAPDDRKDDRRCYQGRAE
jgi:hypothetical protein